MGRPVTTLSGMPSTTTALDLTTDVTSLTAAVCDIESVSLGEAPLADALEAALRELAHLEVTRIGNTVVARTGLGRAERVVLAGHIDTVPLTTDPANLPTRRVDSPAGEVLWGRGTVDMKGGVAVMLRVARELPAPNRDVTFVFYEAEEIDSRFNGLLHVEEQRPELIADADFAVLLEPTGTLVEGGCKGTLRAEVSTKGTAAHSARPWKGHNAIHDAGEILSRLVAYEPATRVVDELEFREALNAVLISGGTATNVIPDRCVVTVNYRYAPDLSEDDAESHVRQVFAGFDVDVVDNAGGARPGLQLPAARAFVEALGMPVEAKQGWTDVARFSAMGVPAVNFGPGDPNLAHMDDERCPVEQYVACEAALLRWLA
jgi:succinyl-diaminopimelate desuccinylase